MMLSVISPLPGILEIKGKQLNRLGKKVPASGLEPESGTPLSAVCRTFRSVHFIENNCPSARYLFLEKLSKMVP